MVVNRVLSLWLLLTSSIASATTWGPPQATLYTDDWGRHLLKVVPELARQFDLTPRVTRLEFQQLQPAGELETLWKTTLTHMPFKVSIRPWGETCVALLDTYAGQGGGKHALVIFKAGGKKVADYAFNDLVSRSEQDRFYWLMSGYFLTSQYAVKWAEYGGVPHVALRDSKGNGPTINCQNGKLKTTWNGSGSRR